MYLIDLSKRVTKHILPALLFLGFLSGCGAGENKRTANRGPIFSFSKARPPAVTGSKEDWCTAPFDTQVPVSAEQINTNRRYFYLQPGVTWLAAERDNSRSNVCFRPLPDGNVEVFTGANFPYCLSRPDYLRVFGDNPATLRYDNGTNIDFNLDLQSEKGRPKVTLEFRTGTFYAINVLYFNEKQER